jgi:translation initiation factor IF-1
VNSPHEYVESMKLGQYTVKVGDLVKVKPSAPGKRNGFADGKVRSIRIDTHTGDVIEVTVVGGPARRPRAIRTYHPDRLAYRRQPKEES